MKHSEIRGGPGRRLCRAKWPIRDRWRSSQDLPARCYLPTIPVVQLSEALKLRKGEAAFTQAATKVPFVNSV
jgi:hypothetical protein